MKEWEIFGNGKLHNIVDLVEVGFLERGSRTTNRTKILETVSPLLSVLNNDPHDTIYHKTIG